MVWNKLTIREVKRRTKEKGFKFLDKIYVNSYFKHKFYCQIDKEIHSSNFNNISGGHGLKCCKRRNDKIKSIGRKNSLKEVKKRSLKNGFKFLDKEYVNVHFKHNFYCMIDKEIYKSTFASINNGCGLICCKKRKCSGNNHYKWKSEITDKERFDGRQVLGLKVWAKKIKNRDNFKCQICDSKENIEAHHIQNYVDNKHLAIDINNGITLCRKHHTLFHRKYGKNNNTKKQFKEFNTFISVGVDKEKFWNSICS